MDWSSASVVREEIAASCRGAPELERLRLNLVRAAVVYVRHRALWRVGRLAIQPGSGATRGAAHDELIEAVNVLARAVAARGRDGGWRRRVGVDRVEIGDFASYLVCMEARDAR